MKSASNTAGVGDTPTMSRSSSISGALKNERSLNVMASAISASVSSRGTASGWGGSTAKSRKTTAAARAAVASLANPERRCCTTWVSSWASSHRPSLAAGAVLAGREHDVVAERVGAGSDALRRTSGAVAVVHTDLREVGAERRLGPPAHGVGERPSRARQIEGGPRDRTVDRGGRRTRRRGPSDVGVVVVARARPRHGWHGHAQHAVGDAIGLVLEGIGRLRHAQVGLHGSAAADHRHGRPGTRSGAATRVARVAIRRTALTVTAR